MGNNFGNQFGKGFVGSFMPGMQMGARQLQTKQSNPLLQALQEERLRASQDRREQRGIGEQRRQAAEQRQVGAEERQATQQLEGRVTELGKRHQAINTPEGVSLVQQTEKAFGPTPEGEHVSSFGGMKGLVPTSMLALGKQFGDALDMQLVHPQELEQRRSVAALTGFFRKPLYGVAVTPTELKSFDEALGQLRTGDLATQKIAISTMKMLIKQRIQNVIASSDPEAVKLYEARGGIKMEDLMGAAEAQTGFAKFTGAPQQQAPTAEEADPERAEFEKLKRELGR